MATGKVCKPNVAIVDRVAQALIYTARCPQSRYGQLRYLQGKGGSSCSTKLCTTAVEICSTVLPSSPLCFPQVMAYLWVSVSKSTSSAVAAQWPHCRRSVRLWPVPGPWHESAAERAWGRGTAAGSVFFSSFLRWPFSTIEGKAEGAGFSVRLPPLHNAHTRSRPALALSDGGALAVSYKETMTNDAGKRRVEARHIASYIHAKASLKLWAIIFCQVARISGKACTRPHDIPSIASRHDDPQSCNARSNYRTRGAATYIER